MPTTESTFSFLFMDLCIFFKKFTLRIGFAKEEIRENMPPIKAKWATLFIDELLSRLRFSMLISHLLLLFLRNPQLFDSVPFITVLCQGQISKICS